MFSPPTPASSPLAHLGSKSTFNHESFYPVHSSPLSGSSSPTNTAQARRQRQYKSHGTSRSAVVPLNLLGVLEDTPQKQFLRDRFKARCLEQAREGRARAVRNRRARDGSSSDGFDIDSDFPMEDDNEDNLDDELYRRVMLNEERRAQYVKRVSFERDFGSSIDPSMYENMDTLEQELTGQKSNLRHLSPPPDELDDMLIQEYLAELEEPENERPQQNVACISTDIINVDKEDPSDLERELMAGNGTEYPSPSRSMYSDVQMTSPPSSPHACPTSSPQKNVFVWNCPFCTTVTPRTQIACPACVRQYPLEQVRLAWIDAELHPEGQHNHHIPLATTTPNESGIGVVMLCGAPECDWCFAFSTSQRD